MTIDIAIVSGFLILNLIIGIYHGKGINTLKYYAIGNRNFSTATIAATIIATWLAGSSFSITTAETYNHGLYFFLPGLGDVMSFFIIAYFYAPRMLEFLGTLSVAEAMGKLYGRNVRLITAISGIIPAVANVAMQFTLLATLLSYNFGISGIYASVISSIIVIIYSSFGGIKSVTFTDIIQFFTFGLVLPIVAFIMWKSLSNTGVSFYNLTQDPLFDYTEVFNHHNPAFLNTIFLFLFFMIPALDPAIFQRISMAKNTRQVARSFMIAGAFIFLCDAVLITFIGVLLKLGNNVEITSTNVLEYILNTYIGSGFKGIFIIGIMAMIMSTADSYVNSASILFAHDVCKSLNIKLTESKELLLVRTCALFIGILALLISLFFKNLLELVLESYGFYMPIVSVSLILAIFGFRSTSKSVLIGMAAGFITVIVFKIYSSIDGLMPGMIANLIFFVGSHYLLKQAGGWVGIKNTTPLAIIKYERAKKCKKFIETIKTFNFSQICKNNSPSDEKIYVYFGLFCFIAIFSQAYSLNNEIYQQHYRLLQFAYYVISFAGTVFIIYPTWNKKFQNKEIIAILWNITIMLLIFINSFIAIISNLHQIQFSIFMATLIIISVLSKWTIAMFMIIFGVGASIQFYKSYIGIDFIANNINSVQLQIVYALMLVSSILISFIKPRQQKEEASEYLNYYLEQQHNNMQLELIKLSRYREEFFNRLDQQCINVFKSTYEQILFLENMAQNSTTINQNNAILKIVNRLKAGAQYLNDIIWTIKNQVKIQPVKTQIVPFIYDTIDDYKKINTDHEIQILFESHTNYQEIEIDQSFINKIIKSCISHGLMNSNSNYVLITIEDTKIEYNINPSNLLNIRRDAVKLSIIINSTYIEQTEIDPLVHQTFITINEINFVDIYKTVAAHYGKMNIYSDKIGNTIYTITIPIQLRDIRPKKTDLPDYEFERINEINNFITAKTKTLLLNIAKGLVQTGMDVDLITKITTLSIKELKEELDI